MRRENEASVWASIYAFFGNLFCCFGKVLVFIGSCSYALFCYLLLVNVHTYLLSNRSGMLRITTRSQMSMVIHIIKFAMPFTFKHGGTMLLYYPQRNESIFQFKQGPRDCTHPLFPITTTSLFFQSSLNIS